MSLRAEIEAAIVDYTRIFRVPYDLAPNLKLASRALAMLDRDRITRILAENGLSGNNEGLHSWRCAYPDRYGDCTCLADLIKDLTEEN